MKKLTFGRVIATVFFLSIVFFIFIGYQTNGSGKTEENMITKASISRSKGIGSVNPDYLMVYEDKKSLSIFNEAILKSKKAEGIVDVTAPEFDLEILYKDGTKQGYHLWTKEKGKTSTLMKADDTHAIYSVPEEISERLRSLIK